MSRLARTEIPPRPEIVSPAGDPEKLRTAFRFGADAVYLGLKRFSLRSKAGNFGWDELEWALGHARERGGRVYVAVNLQPFDPEFADLEPALRRLGQLAPDAVVVADPGVLALARSVAPDLPLNLSTQASVTNALAAGFWFERGIRRIVLARELSIVQLEALCPRAAELGGQFEVFAHGAVCVAWSGRCFLSLYWAHRDPRHGECAQGCRWPYVEIGEANRPGRVHEMTQDERGTYFFDGRDHWSLPVLDRLVASGVEALKIEGRTRSEYYVGITADVYRDATERLAEGDVEGYRALRAAYEAELATACKRGFSTHFLTGEENLGETYLPGGSPVGGEHAHVGRIASVGSAHADILLCNPVLPGAALEVRDRGLSCERLALDVLAAPDGTRLDRARAGETIRVPGRLRAREGALVRIEVPRDGSTPHEAARD